MLFLYRLHKRPDARWIVFDAVRVWIYVLVFALLLILPLQFFEQRSFCIYYYFFGVRCPGCGGTRAIVNLLRGNWLRAWEYNRLAVVIFPILLAIVGHDIYCIIRRYWPQSKPYGKISLIDWFMGRAPGATRKRVH